MTSSMDRGIIGHCQICHTWTKLVVRCTRCHKRSCEGPDCMKLIREVKMCGVPARLLPHGA